MKEKFRVADCKIIKLNKDDTGNGIVIDFFQFDLKRVYYLSGVPSGVSRGSHAHEASSQFIIAVCGSFSIIINDGETEKTFLLNSSGEGLFIKPGIWRELIDFSEKSVCLVLSPENYDEKGCIRNYNEYLEFRNKIK